MKYSVSEGVVIRQREDMQLEAWVAGKWCRYEGIDSDWYFNSKLVTEEEAAAIGGFSLGAAASGEFQNDGRAISSAEDGSAMLSADRTNGPFGPTT